MNPFFSRTWRCLWTVASEERCSPAAISSKLGEKPAITPDRSTSQRYAVRGEIARGGMGAVVSAFDCDIRREVENYAIELRQTT